MFTPLTSNHIKIVGVTQLDLTSDCIQRALAAIFAGQQPFDTVIFAAGILGETQEILEQNPKATSKLFRINVTGTSETLIKVVNELVEQGRGQLITCASIAGSQIRPDNAFYGLTK